MNNISRIKDVLKSFFAEIGELSFFTGRFFKEVFKRPFEFKEFLRQCYNMGNQSLLFGCSHWFYHWTGFYVYNQDLRSKNLVLFLGCLRW
jgi:hypothetical protein